MAKYRITYRLEPPGEAGDVLFVVNRDISRYTPQEPHEWFLERKSDWVGKKVISVEMID